MVYYSKFVYIYDIKTKKINTIIPFSTLSFELIKKAKKKINFFKIYVIINFVKTFFTIFFKKISNINGGVLVLTIKKNF
ncbi:hypothetical protein MHP168_373 [Mesomycoplasma hyopneumoniae 168]|uniref:Uncharacterized protein n=3 Tax=Mesomycoplasma hyopneumoniae TaxID=2099 RepID=Q4A9Z0_MESHJ|nr:hypothetical protein MHJ_0343 [Mesomycoplasma hyopneumoniae J]ADQ90577.1 hypothetical protein MHP168_373 [Mesomycoplasma hyopneumoniae 168]AGM22151.1 hypothetical protein MHP168L_373 [Mesomycoplasma hyopneumoniae 168-L]MXR12861.1 hypothetical protein [Mesomycoplasma hyopneumoniae]QBY87669.1 hypothetical protein E5E95_02025 [Mesomycoplasma hyopneumoniae]